ncbi:hypothetical protein B7494_g6125 [Chlorociboria aeruginascens]|nr:hypothetical protein B7494_g6125 [Chlorociboria aeruginascens]
MWHLANAILDDVVYNLIHDIVLKTHREEKMARASSAAIIVEQKAAETDPNIQDEASGSASATSLPHNVETPAATYNNGEVYLKGNPLKTINEIRCGRCGLPRLLHPTDGNGARRPEPGKEYCKRRPFIDKPYHDVYGQTYVPEGPGRGKKKKDMINPLKAQAAKEGTPTGSQDSPTPSSPSSEEPVKPIAFPHSKCHNCNTFLPIKRMNNHMVKCIGGGGRDSSRTALLKIQNGNSNGSQNGGTPPGSRNSTPAPTAKRNSPTKRVAGEDFESDDSPHKKKKVAKKAMTSNPKLKLKASKIASQPATSNLSFEHKVPNSEDEEDEGEDERDGNFGTVVVETKKKLKAMAKKPKEKETDRKKWLHGKGGVKASLPATPILEPPDAVKSKTKSGVNGRKEDIESESSQTLSSP